MLLTKVKSVQRIGKRMEEGKLRHVFGRGEKPTDEMLVMQIGEEDKRSW